MVCLAVLDLVLGGDLVCIVCVCGSDLSELLAAALSEAGLLQLFLQLSLHQHQLLLQLKHKPNINIQNPTFTSSPSLRGPTC